MAIKHALPKAAARATGWIPAVAYYRMSSDKQETSIDLQRAAVEKWAKDNRRKIIREYVDAGISGWKDERADFQRMITDSAKGDFQEILCWDQDRFSRFSAQEANYYWHILEKAGVRIWTIAQGLLDFSTFTGWLTASIAQHAKNQYSSDLSRNVVNGLLEKKMAGQWLGKAPLGYRVPEGGGKLMLGPPEEVELVELIFRLRVEGRGYRAIAMRLNADGHPTPRGLLWSDQTVKRVITRPTYLGHAVIGRHSRAKFTRLAPEGIVTIRDVHPAIIDQKTWDIVRTMDGQKKEAHWKGDSEGAPLAGLLVCGRCKSKLYAINQTGRPSYYLCGSRHMNGGCRRCKVSQPAMLELVARKLRENVLGGSVKELEAKIAALVERERAQYQAPDNAADVRQIKELDRQIENAHKRLVTVPDSLVPGVEATLLKLQAERDARADKVAASEPRESPITPKEAADQLYAIDQTIRDGNPAEIRNALEQIIKRVVVEFESAGFFGKQERFRSCGGRIDFVTNGETRANPLLVFCNSIVLTREDFKAA